MDKAFIKELIPPIFIRLYRSGTSKYGWFGNYHNWEEAQKQSEGYDSGKIVNKVKDSTLKVKKGEAAFERDSVLFYEREYEWPLLSALLWIAVKNNGKLRIIDFGGALGSTYFQYNQILTPIKDLQWNIVEQESFYLMGKSNFEDSVLKFFPDIESCLAQSEINALLLGCVLPYIKEPFALLEQIFSYNIPNLIIDRMPFITGPQDRLTVQKVPPQIYEASYPAWFFGYDKFIDFISKKYAIVAEYNCNDKANIESTYKGLILEIKV